MDEKTKELIAIGASVNTHCQPCLAYHLDVAKGLGVSEEDIRTAIETGFMVGRGAGDAMRKYVRDIGGNRSGKMNGHSLHEMSTSLVMAIGKRTDNEKT